MTTFSDIPVEVVSHILGFLPVADRKEVSLVSRLWYSASLHPALQKDIVVNLHTFLLNHDQQDLKDLKNTRPATNMVLDGLSNNDSWKESCQIFGKSLQTLSVKGCDITESTFVMFLSYCSCLTSLDLTGCNSMFMTGKLLEKESDRAMLKSVLCNVKELNLSSLRYLSNTTFIRLVSVLGNLEKLDLSCCQILFHSNRNTAYADGTLFTFDTILDYLKKNPKLKSLFLSKTAVTNDALCALASIPDLVLKSLDLSYCRDISHPGLKVLCQKQNQIEHLDLTGCPEIGDIVVEEIVNNLLNIKDLTLKQCSFVTDRSIKKLNALKKLQSLNLAGVHRPSHVGLTNGLGQNLESLASLCLSGNSAVNDSVVLTLCLNLPNLLSLDVSSCFYITDNGLVGIFHYLQRLRELNLAHCKKITDLGLLGLKADENDHNHMEGACKCVRKKRSPFVFQLGIRLDDIPNITAEHIDKLQEKVSSHVASLKDLTFLNSLNLQGISNVSDLSLTQAIHFRNLKSLNLNMCSRVTDASVFPIIDRNPNIEEIGLGSTGISDLGLKHLVKGLPRLKHLTVSNCDQITDYSITSIGNYCRRLRYLDVSFSQVTEVAVDYLDIRLPQLRELHKRYIKSE